MSDKYNLYRLSSTRELAVIKDRNNYDKSVLYGGMKYDTDPSVLVKDMERYPELKNRDFMTLNIADSLNLRNGVSELPGTVIEVENIRSALERTSITPILYTGLDGTEASFKSLSGKKVNLMHIATHGFYFTETEARRMSDLAFLTTAGAEHHKIVEDKTLTHAGLLFSGANYALRGNRLPDNVEDGVLTAKEISHLDLRGLDLVVLSACKTGVGDITGDGVFGLQRGFKKAGANSLLMSLWTVDDRATQMLMTMFYDYFLQGKSKTDSLKLAQQDLRNYEEFQIVAAPGTYTFEEKMVKPFESPQYWAAFILLDAID